VSLGRVSVAAFVGDIVAVAALVVSGDATGVIRRWRIGDAASVAL